MGLGLDEFAAEAVHDGAGASVQALEVGLGHLRGGRRSGGWRRSRRRGRGGRGRRRALGALVLEFRRELALVLFVDGLEFPACVADRAGGAGQGGTVGDRRLVRLLDALDQEVQPFDVRPRRRALPRRPRLDQSLAVRAQPRQVGARELMGTAPARDALPVTVGLLVLERRPHAPYVEVEPVGGTGVTATHVGDEHQDTPELSVTGGGLVPGSGRRAADVLSSADSTSLTRASANASDLP